MDAGALGRFAASWQGVARRRAGLDALLDAVEQLQGAPLPASELEREILPARVEGYRARRPRSAPRGRRGRVARRRAARRSRRTPRPLSDRSPAPAACLRDRVCQSTRSRAADRRRISAARGHRSSRPPRGHRRRLPARSRSARSGIARLAWRRHERHAAGAAGVRRAAETRATRTGRAAFRSRRVTPPDALGRWSLVADRLRDVRRAPSGRRPSRVSCSRVTAS